MQDAGVVRRCRRRHKPRSTRLNGFVSTIAGKGFRYGACRAGGLTLTYKSLDSIDYSAGGQLYGVMEGSLTGERLRGDLHLTNLAARRPDNVNLPTLRGVLTTLDEAEVWVELDGIAMLRESDKARVFVTGCRFRTGDERYSWLNGVFAILEGVLDNVAVGGQARGRLFECRATVS